METRPRDPADVSFHALYDGPLAGILRWEDLDRLWKAVRNEPDGWYVYQVGEEPPAVPADAEVLLRFLEEADALLRREHRERICGIVYADAPAAPRLIKIYDPGNLGSVCGSSGTRVPPRWVLSRLPPEPVDDPAPVPSNRRRWWQRLFGGGGGRAPGAG